VAFVMEFDARNNILRLTLEGVVTGAILLMATQPPQDMWRPTNRVTALLTCQGWRNLKFPAAL